MLSKEQLANRASGLGGSDMAAVLGQSPYRTCLQVFLEKTGELAPDDLSDNPKVQAGNFFEESIAKLYAWQNSTILTPFTETVYHPDYVFLLANPDYRDSEGGIIEIKNMDVDVAYSYGWPSNFKAPVHYMIQLMYYCILTDAPYGKLVCHITGARFEVTHYERDTQVERWLINNAVDFWERHVMTRTAPPASTLKDIQFLFPVSENKSVVGRQDINMLLKEYADLTQSISQAQKRKDEIQLSVSGYMGEHDTLLSPTEEVLATWRTHERSSFNTTAFKKDHPTLYADYCINKNCRPFVVKSVAGV